MEETERRLIVEELRNQWRELWITRFDDKVRAEGISRQDYPKLFVERGTVMIATRKYKPLSFHEILQQHLPEDDTNGVPPHPFYGGYRKFIRDFIVRQKRETGQKRPSLPSTKRGEKPSRKKVRRWIQY